MNCQYRIRTCMPLVAALLAAGIAGAASAAEELVPLDRTILPIQAPKPPVYKELDVRQAIAPPLIWLRNCFYLVVCRKFCKNGKTMACGV